MFMEIHAFGNTCLWKYLFLEIHVYSKTFMKILFYGTTFFGVCVEGGGVQVYGYIAYVYLLHHDFGLILSTEYNIF